MALTPETSTLTPEIRHSHPKFDQLLDRGLEIPDLDAFITRNITEIFANSAVQDALKTVLRRNTSSSRGDDAQALEIAHLRGLVERGVPPSQVEI